MISIWSADSTLTDRQCLKEDIKVDVAVIGAGMAGILIANSLKEKGLKVVIIEADKVANGVTKNTTAKITSQHSLIYDKLTKETSQEIARQYASANEKAIKLYKKIIKEKNIDCNFEEMPAYVYAKENKEAIEAEVEAANRIGIKASLETINPLPYPIAAMVKFENQAQFNPLQFIQAIALELTIYEHTKVLSVEEQVVTTDKGKVIADHIVMATHFPFINAPGYYFARMFQQRSYVIALEHAQKLNGMYIDAQEDGFSLRQYKDMLLFGGGGHRTGKNELGGSYEKLRKAAKGFYPEAIEKYYWSTQDCMTLDGIPYIGQFSSKTPNLYVATGFNKWGMTSSMVSAIILTDLIIHQESEYSECFTPQRFHASASTKNLVVDGVETVSGLFTQLFTKAKSEIEQIEKEHAGTIDYEGMKVGIYKDKDGEIFMVTTKCPHLGCQLSWNQDELSWDCPCHGSRFDYKGGLIGNPATKGIAIEKVD